MHWARKPRWWGVQSIPVCEPALVGKTDVKNADGSTVEWSFVGGSVTSIARFGLKEGPNALTPGDPITVTCTPAADGKSPVGLLVAITYKDGHTVRFRGVDE